MVCLTFRACSDNYAGLSAFLSVHTDASPSGMAVGGRLKGVPPELLRAARPAYAWPAHGEMAGKREHFLMHGRRQ